MKAIKALPPLTIGILVIVVIFFVFVAGNTLLSSIRNFLDFRGNAQITTSRTVVQGIKPLGQLVSINAQLAKVGVEVNIRRGIGNVCYFWGIHAAQGEVSAGIDLTKIDDASITYDEESNTYHLSLPAPELTSCSLDPIHTQQYETGGATPLCPMNWDEVRRLASYVALREFRDEAIEGGLLDRAMQQSDLVLSNFIKALTGADVVISYKQPEEGVTSYPATCDPEPPGNWYFDETDQRWLER